MTGIGGSIRAIARMDDLARADSPVHRLSPFVKLISTLVFIITVVSFPPKAVAPLMAFFIYPAILLPLSSVPAGEIMKRLFIALPFPLLAGISNLFFDRTPMAVLFGVTVTGGLLSLLSLMIKTVLSVSSVLLLMATTPFSALTDELARLKVPPVFLISFTMVYRYVALLVTESHRMSKAYVLRANGARSVGFSDAGAFLGQLLLRSFGRAERVYSAMRLKGFDGMQIPPARPPLRAGDAFFLSAVCLLSLTLRFINLPLLLGGLLVGGIG